MTETPPFTGRRKIKKHPSNKYSRAYTHKEEYSFVRLELWPKVNRLHKWFFSL